MSLDLGAVSDEELAAEIERRKEVNELALLITKDGFSTEEKENIFNFLHDYVFNGMKETIKNGYPPKDFKHYVYEATMSKLLGDSVWQVINKYP